MKVVLFCGGLGVRMGEATQRIPKPMIPVGTQPILFHIMRWYASWGHREFILCLGYRAEVIKRFFLEYNEALANDFVLAEGRVELLARDTEDWKITFLDTGVQATIADRLRAAEPYIGQDEVFLANYGDGLTDAPLDEMITVLQRSGKTALFMSVRPRIDYHVVRFGEGGLVNSIERMSVADVRINGGYFVFRRAIFDVLEPGDELVEQPFSRLIERGELLAYSYDGFWEPMDTIKDKQKLDALLESGQAPWIDGGRRR